MQVARAASALVDSCCGSGASAEQLPTPASTSYASATEILGSGHQRSAWSQIGFTRSYKKHFVNRPNLAQPLDVNTLDEALQRATSPAAAALPVLKFSMYMNPRQTTYMLQKLPRLEALHRLRFGRGWSHEEQQMYHVVMTCLQQRLCQVMMDCKPSELQHGLWGLATAG